MVTYSIVSQVEQTWFDPRTNVPVQGVKITVGVGSGDTISVNVPAGTYASPDAVKALIVAAVQNYDAINNISG